jgi:hypothetical protein
MSFPSSSSCSLSLPHLCLLCCVIVCVGSQYSIPKAKGGRVNSDLILTEDVYLEKLKQQGYKHKNPNRQKRTQIRSRRQARKSASRDDDDFKLAFIVKHHKHC